MLVVAVVVDRDHAASDVGVARRSRRRPGSSDGWPWCRAEPRLLGLDEIADTVMAFELGAGAQIGEWADFAMRSRYGIPRRARQASDGIRRRSSTSRRYAVPSIRTPSPTLLRPRICTLGPITRVAPDFDLLADIGGRRIDNRHPRFHQLAVNRRPESRLPSLPSPSVN